MKNFIRHKRSNLESLGIGFLVGGGGFLIGAGFSNKFTLDILTAVIKQVL